MSKTVDSRIVEMQFDNKDFEKNVSTSLNTLDNLNRQLKDLEGARGLEEVGKAAKNVNMSSLNDEVNKTGKSFSALQEIAIGCFRELGGSITKFGMQIASDVLAPVQSVIKAFNELASIPLTSLNAGFDKFKDKTGSVGTLISQGYDMDLVTEQLEKLNFFTDETSYNFTDMVNEIGKFTAAGQELDDSVEAMMGIANWAALSGQNATKASQAMYQLSQAMGKGALKLDDYKSIQNANMDTQEFRKNAIEAAKAIGTIREEANGMFKILKTGKTFTFQEMFTSDALTKGAWLSSDVMMSVFKKYSSAVDQIYEKVQDGTYETASEAIAAMGDSLDAFGLKAFKAAQEARSWTDVVDSLKDAASTSWMNIFEQIFGNYEEAKDLFTDMANNFYDILVTPIQEFGEIFEEWNFIGGREIFWEAFWEMLEGIGRLLEPIKEAFREIFGEFDPEALGDKLFILTLRFKDWAKQLGWSEKTAENLKNVCKGLFAIVKAGINTTKGLWQAAQPFVRIAKTILSFVMTLAGWLGDLISGITGVTGATEGLYAISSRIEGIFYGLAEPLETFKENLLNIFDGHWLGSESGIFNYVNTLFELLKSLVALIIDTVSVITGIDLSGFENNVIGAMNHVRDEVRLRIEEVKALISKAFENLQINTEGILDSIKLFFTDADYRHQMIEIGKNCILGLIQGMKEAAWNLLPDCVKEIALNVIAWFKDTFGVRSPSVVFAWIGEMLMAGFEQGIRVGIANYVTPVLKELIDTILSFLEQGGVKESIENLGQSIMYVLGGIFDTIKHVLLDKNEDGEYIGINILLGIGKGIMSGIDKLLPVIFEVCKKILKGFTDFFLISSPSALMAAIVGTMIVAGIAVGIQEAIPLLGPAFDDLKIWFENMQGYFKPLKEIIVTAMDTLAIATKAIGKVIKDVSDAIIQSDFGPRLKTFFDNLQIETIIKDAKKIIVLTAIFWSIAKVLNLASSVVKLGETAVNKLGGFLGAISDLGKGINDLVKTMKTEIKVRMVRTLVRDLAITLAAITASIYVLGKMPVDVFEKGAKYVAIIGGCLAGVVTILMSIAAFAPQGVLALEALNHFGLIFIGMGASIYLIAMAIKKIGNINFDSMNQATTVLVGIGTFFILYQGLIVLLSSIFGNEAVNSVWKVLIASAGSIYILAMALSKIASIDSENLDTAYLMVVTLELVTMAFVDFIVLSSKLSKGSTAMTLNGLAAAILSVGLCVNLLVNAMRHIGVLVKSGKAFIAAIGVLAGIFVGLGVLFQVTGKMSRAWKSLASMAALFLSMGLVVKIVGEMEIHDIMEGVGTLAAISLFIMGLAAVTALINKKLGSDTTADVAKTLVASAASMLILGYAIQNLAQLTPYQLKKGAQTIILLTMCMSALIVAAGAANAMGGKLGSSVSGSWKKKNFSSVKEKSNGTGFGQMIGAAISIGILAYAVAQLAKIPEDELSRGAGIIFVLSMVMAGLIALMGKMASSPNIKIGNIIALTVAIGVITAGLVVLTFFADEGDPIIAGAIGLSAVLVALSASLKILSTISADKALTNMGMLLSICLTIAVVGATLSLVAMYPWESIAAAGASMLGVIGTMILIMAVLGTLGKSGIGLIGIGILLAVAAAIAAVGLTMAYYIGTITQFMETIKSLFTEDTANQIIAFFETIANRLPELASMMGEAIAQAIDAITAKVPDIEEAMDALVQAIAAGFDALVTSIDTNITPVALEFNKVANAIKQAITEPFGINSPSTWFMKIGYWMLEGLKQGLIAFMPGPVKAIVLVGKALENAFRDTVQVHSLSPLFFGIAKFCMMSVGLGFLSEKLFVTNSAQEVGEAAEDGLEAGLSHILSGDLAKQISEQLGLAIPEGISLGDLFKDFDLSGLDISKLDFSSMTDADLSTFISQLKEAGTDAEDLEQIINNIQNGDNNIEFKATLDTQGLEAATKKVMSGAYGNGLPRWKKLYEEYLKSFNGDTAKAVQAVVDIQNNVNKTLGNKTVHNLDEMAKRLGVSASEIKKSSESAEKASKEAAKASKPVTYGSDEYYKETSKHGKTVNNQLNKDVVRYGTDKYYEQANGLSINTLKTERMITDEKHKQVEEEYNQLRANNELVSANERNLSMARLKATEERLASSTITENQRAQLTAEKEQYQAVVDTYNKQQDMRNVINSATNAQKEQTKAVEDTKRAVEETAKASKPVVYGSDEYYRQAKGGSINRMATREEYPVEATAKIEKVEAPDTTPIKEAIEQSGPVKADTKVEVSAKIDVVDVDTSDLEKEVTKAVEIESKKIQTVVEIKPKVDVTDANKAIDDFKTKTKDMSQTIPESFKGVGSEIAKFMGNVANTIRSESPKIETNYKNAFITAATKAATAMNSSTIINKFVNAGVQAANGLIKGLKSKQSDVVNAGKALGNAAANATKTSLKVKSPSKIMEQIGIYAGEGLENGILSTLGSIYSAGIKMSDATIDGLKTNIDSIQYALDNIDVDYSPTIIPVIDTSQIQAGIGNINNIIGQDRITGITANMDLSAQYNESRMQTMQDQLNNMRGAINDLSNAVLNQPVPEVTANVNLLGDADGVFKVVQTANNRYTKMHGRSAFA